MESCLSARLSLKVSYQSVMLFSENGSDDFTDFLMKFGIDNALGQLWYNEFRLQILREKIDFQLLAVVKPHNNCPENGQ